MLNLFTRKPSEPAEQVAPRTEHTFVRGDRVKVNQQSGFHRGATGTIAFVQPGGLSNDRIWVDRDGASSAVFFLPYELELTNEKPSAKVMVLYLKEPTMSEVVEFFRQHGVVSLKQEKHGNGPLHYSCENRGMVFEIYPAHDSTPRVGFIKA